MFSWMKWYWPDVQPSELLCHKIEVPESRNLLTYNSRSIFPVHKIEEEARFVVIPVSWSGSIQCPVGAFKYRHEAEEYILDSLKHSKALICEVVAKSCPQPPLVKDVS